MEVGHPNNKPIHVIFVTPNERLYDNK